MVNRVSGGSGYHIYDSVNLTGKNDQDSDNRGSDYADIANNVSDDDRNGVVLDLSGSEKKIASQKDARTVEKETSDVKQADEDLSLSADTSADTSSSSTSSFISSVKDTINQLITVFKNFFASLWNGSGKSSDITDSDDKAAALSSDDLSDTDSTDIMPANENVLSETEDVIDLPKTDDLDSIKSYLNDYNGHRLARNSSLLTSYDRFGRLVEPGVSDKDKILRGDSESLMNQLRRKK